MNQNSSRENEEINDWRNEHGEPDFAYLQSLAITGTTESLDKLKSIAEDLNVDYDSNASAEDLVGKIRLAVEQNEDGDSSITT